MPRDTDLQKMKAEVARARERPLKRVKGGRELEISWCRTSAKSLFLLSKWCECLKRKDGNFAKRIIMSIARLYVGVADLLR